MVSVTVWNEFVNEQELDGVANTYPDGIHAVISKALGDRGYDVTTATLHDDEHGLTEAVLRETDVLTWWGHAAHDAVQDRVVDRVQARVLDGMGLIVLHSGHMSKIFRRLTGTSCRLKWRDAPERERLWVVEPGHPIASGIDECIELPRTEMYGEPFEIPQPDTLVFSSWFEGGNTFRSGCCYRRQRGRIFYFRPGHESYPIYYDESVQRVLANAVEWAAPDEGAKYELGNEADPREPIEDGESFPGHGWDRSA